jgi:hypothetical protein
MTQGVFDQTAVQAILDTTPVDAWCYEFHVADRCDRCGAQAFVAVRVTNQEGTQTVLLFCGHHYHTHGVALEVVATDIADQRHRINDKPSSTSGTEYEH